MRAVLQRVRRARVTVGEETGPAAVSVTTYGDGRAEQTLVLQLGGYSLYFAVDKDIKD